MKETPKVQNPSSKILPFRGREGKSNGVCACKVVEEEQMVGGKKTFDVNWLIFFLSLS